MTELQKEFVKDIVSNRDGLYRGGIKKWPPKRIANHLLKGWSFLGMDVESYQKQRDEIMKYAEELYSAENGHE